MKLSVLEHVMKMPVLEAIMRIAALAYQRRSLIQTELKIQKTIQKK